MLFAKKSLRSQHYFLYNPHSFQLSQPSQLTSCSQAIKEEPKSLPHSSFDGDLQVCFVSLHACAYSSVKPTVNTRKGQLSTNDNTLIPNGCDDQLSVAHSVTCRESFLFTMGFEM